MSFFPTSGKHKCLAKDKNFAAVLGTGTAIKVAITGKMNGLLGGFSVTGFGALEYTYVQGATEWVRTDIDGSAQGPASIPVGSPAPGLFDLVYDPAGKCSGKVSIEVTGDADVATEGFKFKHKKDVWKMKGRTDKLTISITQSVAVDCDALWANIMPDSTFACADYESVGNNGEQYIITFRNGNVAAQDLVDAGCAASTAEALAAAGLAADELYLDATYACV